MAVADIREFFRAALQHALRHQQVSVRDQTEHYVVNLLAMFARTEALFEPAPGKPSRLKPLALLLAEAVETPDERLRYRLLQRLGDVALFVAGFLAGQSSRSVDVGYHVAMGEGAYGSLAQAPCHGAKRALSSVFAELSDKFQPLVDALNDIGGDADASTPQDLLRLYEMWQRTGSRRAHRLLMNLGVQPLPAGAFAH
jgi:hypothetical protein